MNCGKIDKKKSLKQTLSGHYQSKHKIVSSEEIASAEANLVGFITLLAEADTKHSRQIMKEAMLEESIKFLLS